MSFKIFQARDKQLLTPLHLACSYEKADVAKILLEAGATIRCVGEKLQTPIHKVSKDANMVLNANMSNIKSDREFYL